MPRRLVERLAPAAAVPPSDLPQQSDPRQQVDVVVDGVRRPPHPFGEIAHRQQLGPGELAEDLDTERGGERLALLAGDSVARRSGHGCNVTRVLKIVNSF